MTMLYNDNVVFYHPLDNYEEFTTSQIWDGSGSFVPGQVGSGNSAISIKSLDINDSSTIADEIVICPFPAKHGGVAIDDTHIVAIWGSGDYIKVNAFEVSGSMIINSGEPVVLGEKYNNLQQLWSIAHLVSGECIAAYTKVDPIEGRCVRLSVSGVTITEKNDLTLYNHGLFMRAVRVDDTRAALCYRYYDDEKCWVASQIISLSGENDLSAGAQALATTGYATDPYSDLAVPSPSSIIIGYVYAGSNPKHGYVCPGSISGTTITFPSGDYGGSGYLVHDSCWSSNCYDACSLHMTPVSGDYFTVSYVVEGGPDDYHAFSIVGTISGSDIVLGEKYEWPSNVVQNASFISVDKVNDNNFVFCCHSGSVSYDDLAVAIGIIDVNDLSIDFGSQQSCGFTVSVAIPSVFRLNDNKVMVVAADALTDGKIEALVADLNYGASMISPLDIYPAVSGTDHITLGMWVKNPTISSTEIVAGRSYDISIDSNSGITFGHNSAIWNNSGVLDWINSLNDSNNHLVLLDFYNTSGDNWQLKTSIDGSGFVNWGEQDSGSQTKNVDETVPALYINDGYFGLQWIDELIMWAGDFDFTDQQLINLYNLGSVLHLPMNQYSDYYTDNVSGTIDLFISNFVKIHNAPTNDALYFVDAILDKLSRSSLDGENIVDLITSGMVTPNDVEIDAVNNKIYWLDQGFGQRNVRRCNFDGSNIELIFSNPAGGLQFIALDVDNNKIYISESFGNIKKADLDGSNLETIVSGVTYLAGIDLDLINSKIYWTTTAEASGTIQRSDFDGSNIQIIISGLEDPYAINVDAANNCLYWANCWPNISTEIMRATLDGENQEIVVPSGAGLHQIRDIDIDLFTEKIYFSDLNWDYTSGTIYRVNYNGSNLEAVVSDLGGLRGIDIFSDPSKVGLYISGIGNISDNINLYTINFECLNSGISLYASGYGHITDSINLYIRGVDGISGSVDCYTSGLGYISANSPFVVIGGTSGYLPDDQIVAPSVSVDTFIKSADYSPQLIGVFSGIVNVVAIEVFDITNANNDLLTLSSGYCYQIGNTNRWGWSTSNLPQLTGSHYQFIYRMCADDDQYFEGEFFLDTPETVKWCHPRSMLNYVV